MSGWYVSNDMSQFPDLAKNEIHRAGSMYWAYSSLFSHAKKETVSRRRSGDPARHPLRVLSYTATLPHRHTWRTTGFYNDRARERFALLPSFGACGSLQQFAMVSIINRRRYATNHCCEPSLSHESDNCLQKILHILLTSRHHCMAGVMAPMYSPFHWQSCLTGACMRKGKMQRSSTH